MKIQTICDAQFNRMPFINRADTQNKQFGIKMAQSISTDTLSFQGKTPKMSVKDMAAIARKEARALRDARQIAEAKKSAEKTAPTKKNLSGEERKRGVSRSTAKQIHEMILKPQKQINNFMEEIFGDLVVTELNPKNPILKMSGRPKSDISIVEKSATRDWNSVDEILEKMTDLNGRKIVFNYKTGKPEAESALDRLIPLIKTKQVFLKEIELQRPEAIKGMSKQDQEEFDYFSKAFLDKLEDAQEEVINGSETNVDKIKLIERPLPKYTKFNYCALHLLLQTNEKGSRTFELQIMGPREAAGKPFDDKCFKKFDNKELDKMYAPLISLWDGLIPKENAAAKERFFQYRKDANLQLRKDEIQEYKTQRLIKRPNGHFISVRNYGLPPEYDLNYQYALMRQCEAEAQKAKEKAKEEVSVKKVEQKIGEQVTKVEKHVIEFAKETKERVDITKEKLQNLVAKYTHPKLNKGKDKTKI